MSCLSRHYLGCSSSCSSIKPPRNGEAEWGIQLSPSAAPPRGSQEPGTLGERGRVRRPEAQASWAFMASGLMEQKALANRDSEQAAGACALAQLFKKQRQVHFRQRRRGGSVSSPATAR